MADKIMIGIVDERRPPWRRLVKAMTGLAIIPGALFGPGLLADSAAMQWAGFVLFILLLVVCVIAWDRERLTIQEARDKLDKLERDGA